MIGRIDVVSYLLVLIVAKIVVEAENDDWGDGDRWWIRNSSAWKSRERDCRVRREVWMEGKVVGLRTKEMGCNE